MTRDEKWYASLGLERQSSGDELRLPENEGEV